MSLSDQGGDGGVKDEDFDAYVLKQGPMFYTEWQRWQNTLIKKACSINELEALLTDYGAYLDDDQLRKFRDSLIISSGVDLMNLYLIVKRSARLKILIGMRAPDMIINNERRLLHAAISSV